MTMIGKAGNYTLGAARLAIARKSAIPLRRHQCYSPCTNYRLLIYLIFMTLQMIMRRTLAIVLSLSGGAIQQAALAEGLKVQESAYGVFNKPDHELAPGERLLTSHMEVSETTQVPARLGVKFGISYKLSDESYGGKKPVVTLLYLTPGILDANTGKRLDKIELTQELSSASPRHLMAFEFTDKAELTPGEWKFMVFDEDRLLLQQTFQVTLDP